MTDDIYFAEQQCSLVEPESDSSLGLAEPQCSFVQPEDNPSLSQDLGAPARPINHVQKMPIEMIIGSWYLDEFGNPTREIKARD